MTLRPDLYNRLRARARQYGFGDVRFANEGEEMRATVETDGLTDKPRLNVSWPGEYMVVCCPLCNDTRHRLWINHLWGRRDPRTGDLNLWLAHCYNEDCLSRPGNAWKLYQMVYDDITNGRRPDAYDPVLKGKRAPAGPRVVKPAGATVDLLHALPADHPANEYLRSRGFDPNQLGRELGVGYCLNAYPEFPRANDRIIVPVTMRGELVGWQARYIGEPADPRVPKYATMRSMRKSELLYNYDRASKCPFVVITEGVTDVWAFGPEAVALFGKTMSATQAMLVAGTWGRGAAVVLLDGDAEAEAMKVFASLRVAKKALVQLPPDTDPGEFPQAALREYVFAVAKEQGVDLGVSS